MHAKSKEKHDFSWFFQLPPGRARQRGAGPPRYHTPMTGTRRAVQPGRAARPLPYRAAFLIPSTVTEGWRQKHIGVRSFKGNLHLEEKSKI